MTTKRALLRMLERDREAFFAIIREQNDRIADLAGRPWTPSPVATALALDDRDPVIPDLVAVPDHWGDGEVG